jgi:hypothetical protein
MAKLTLIPDPRVPAFDKLRGWRWFANTFLFFKYPRARVVIQTADGYFMCHPDTVSVVTNFWTQQGYTYEIDRRAVVKSAPPGAGA